MDDDHVAAAAGQLPEVGRLAHRQGRRPGRRARLANYRAFSNFHQWEDVDGDGQIVIGAEQWPGCLNPVTECANSSWYVWTVVVPAAAGDLGHARPTQTFEITNLVTGEPVVEIAE